MATTATQATVVFNKAPPLGFAPHPEAPQPNQLRFRIGPGDGVDLLVQTKLPGDDIHLVTTPLTVDYETQFGRIPMAYERVLLEAMQDDRTQFARGDAIEEAWRIVDAVSDPTGEPEAYTPGSWGPPSAARIVDRGRKWIDPS
jgi:glucose-6-phosphate 1-dehydrogenase